MEHLEHVQTSKISNPNSSAIKIDRISEEISNCEMEARYRYFLVDPPPEVHRIDMDRLKRWLKRVFS